MHSAHAPESHEYAEQGQNNAQARHHIQLDLELASLVAQIVIINRDGRYDQSVVRHSTLGCWGYRRIWDTVGEGNSFLEDR